MASPVTMALPKTIKPMATAPAISTISIWIATVYPLAPLLSATHMGSGSNNSAPLGNARSINQLAGTKILIGSKRSEGRELQCPDTGCVGGARIGEE
jgi:hypothetical protein